MATVYAYIKISPTKTNDKNNLKNLIFRVRHAKQFELTYTSNLIIKGKDWNNEAQQVRTSFDIDKQKRGDFNAEVIKIKDTIFSILNTLTTYDGITSKWLAERMDRSINPQKYAPVVEEQKPTTFLEWVDKFVADAPERKDKRTGRLLSVSNIKQYKTTQKHLKAFAKSKKIKDFEFEQIDQQFYDGFVKYLQNEITKVGADSETIVIKEGFTANSVGKYIKVLKLMLKEAITVGISNNQAYNSFCVFSEDVDNVYLTEAELKQLKDIDFSKNLCYDRVRDWFLLLAWTGCRFSDLEKVGKTDIKDGFITFRQQKTNTKVTIPLHPVVMEILHKYDFSLPTPISNQKFNLFIKEVAKMAKIESQETTTVTIGGELQTTTQPKYELITSHTGRRSFCTNMYKQGLPTLMIMSISGHKTEKSFLKYIKISNEEHAQMMAKKWTEIYK